MMRNSYGYLHYFMIESSLQLHRYKCKIFIKQEIRRIKALNKQETQVLGLKLKNTNDRIDV